MASLFKQAVQFTSKISNGLFTVAARHNGRGQTRYERRMYGGIDRGPFPIRPPPEVQFEQAKVIRLPVAFTGSTYDTQLKRYNPITNPSKPVLLGPDVRNECLKWTDWRMRKDVKRRWMVSEYFPLKQNLISLYRNRVLPKEIRDEVRKDILSLPIPYTSVTHVWNRCCVTSRVRGKLRPYRLSRIFWRHLADYNLLSGIKKANWNWADQNLPNVLPPIKELPYKQSKNN